MKGRRDEKSPPNFRKFGMTFLVLGLKEEEGLWCCLSWNITRGGDEPRERKGETKPKEEEQDPNAI